MKAIEQYFQVVLFNMLYKVVLTFKSVDEPLCVTIQMKAYQQYFHVVLFVYPHLAKGNFELWHSWESISIVREYANMP